MPGLEMYSIMFAWQGNQTEYAGQEVERMEAAMTDYQFRKLIQMVLTIMEKSDDLEEATKLIKALLDKEPN